MIDNNVLENWDIIREMIILLGTLLIAWKGISTADKKFPDKKEVTTWLNIAERGASKTKTLVDDILIGIARILNGMRSSVSGLRPDRPAVEPPA